MPRDWPRSILALDTETTAAPDPDKPGAMRHSLRLACAEYCRLWDGEPREWGRSVMRTEADVWAWLEALLAESRDLWVFAHNAPFDWQIIGGMRRLWAGHLRLDAPPGAFGAEYHSRGIIIPDPPPFALRCWTESGSRLTVLDTHNWFRLPLADAAGIVGLDKTPLPTADAPDSEWTEHCRRDAEIVMALARLLEREYRESGHRRFPWSAAGGAWSDWSRSAKPSKWKVSPLGPQRAAERAAYYGARAEVLYRFPVREPIWHLDVNGLYASCMASTPVPVRPDAHMPADGTLHRLDGETAARSIARVRMVATKWQYPVRVGERVRWAAGSLETWLAGPELARAHAAGEIARVMESYTYKLGDHLRTWAAKRVEGRAAAAAAGNRARAEMLKLSVNSLYGKFGRRRPEWDYAGRHGDAPAEIWEQIVDLRGKTPIRTARWGPWEFESPAEREDPRAWPAVAAWVASSARVRMDELVAAAGPRTVFYRAADGLFVNNRGYDRLCRAGEIDPAAPGRLRIVTVAESADFRRVNAVRVGGRYRVAGIRSGSEQIGEWEWETEAFEGAAARLRRPPAADVVVSKSARSVRVPDDVRPATADGWLSHWKFSS